MEEFVPKEIERIRALVGPKGQVLGAVSGGVDSTACALRALPHEIRSVDEYSSAIGSCDPHAHSYR